MRPPSPRLGLQWGFPKHTPEKPCFRQDSNLRPSACEADVITTTLRKPIDHTMRGTSKKTTYVASFAKYCARPMPSTWSPWRNRPARSALNITKRLVVQAHPGTVTFACLKSQSNHNKSRPIGKQKMLEKITSCKYPKRRWQ